MVYEFKDYEARFINKARVMRFSSISKEGYPHVVPLCHVYDNGYLYAVTDYGTKKLRNIEHNNKVAVIVDEYGEPWGKNKGIMIQGRAEILERGEEFRRVAQLLTRKFPYYEREPYGPIEEGDAPIIKIIPEKAVSWGLKPRYKR
ncbi:MAG: pyridoxamine 5'-phosphate oxidase family protein [Nitrososphaerota archaeon]|nr:pyridoxamine 5'-phosphate oxidase family protein [Nitrososphaerota archaeon]